MGVATRATHGHVRARRPGWTGGLLSPALHRCICRRSRRLAVVSFLLPASGQEEARMLLIDHVAKQYGGRSVLAGASLTVGEHEKVALIGPNGSGKSTLARLIVGIEAPDAGSVAGAFAGLRDAY